MADFLSQIDECLTKEDTVKFLQALPLGGLGTSLETLPLEGVKAMLDNAHEGPMATAKRINETCYAHMTRMGLVAQVHSVEVRKAAHMHVTDWPAAQWDDPLLE